MVPTNLDSSSDPRSPADHGFWRANGIDLALSDIDRLQRSLVHAAGLYRAGDEGSEAGAFYKHCAEGIQLFLTHLATTETALGLDLAKCYWEKSSLFNLREELLQVVRTIATSQENRDYESVADKVEFELLHNLHAWSQGLRAINTTSETY